MLEVQFGKHRNNCQGTSRRTALKAGFLGLAGLTQADLFRLQAEGAVQDRKKSVILLWLDGGPSQLETYDPKPHAPVEYRGPWGAISTNVPGMEVSEILPMHAQHADKMVFVRSVHHDNGDHFAAAHWMLTGRHGSTAADKNQKYPSVGSYISRVRGPNNRNLPAYVGLPSAHSVYIYPGYQGSAYLGASYNPFQLNDQQKYLSAKYTSPIKPPQILENVSTDAAGRSQNRFDLLTKIDGLRREVDQTGMMDSLDKYQQQAVNMILGGEARKAFDIEQEDPKLRDRYGRGPWGHYTLLARRIVEAGVTFVTVDMPHWDDHSRIKDGHGYKLPVVDQAVSALLDDLSLRGMLDDVLVVVMGEFGRTPRLNQGQPGIPIPGRDHWGNAISVMMAGGGLQGGAIVGKTNDKAEHPIERAVKPDSILATVYHVMGIDTSQTFPDHSGRPVAILPDNEPLREIL